jgi:hypothetical protein
MNASMVLPVSVKENVSSKELVVGTHSFTGESTYQDFVDYTYSNFLHKLALLQQTNTPERLLAFLSQEVSELGEALQENKAFTEVVAEVGDLFHFLHDEIMITGLSVAALLEWIDAPDIDIEKATIEQVQDAFIDKKMLAEDPLVLIGRLQQFLESARRLTIVNESILATIAHYIFTIAAALNVNIIHATLMKNLRNRSKYPRENELLHDPTGDYDTARKELVVLWNAQGGDAAFFEEWSRVVPPELAFATARELVQGTRSGYSNKDWVVAA